MSTKGLKQIVKHKYIKTYSLFDWVGNLGKTPKKFHVQWKEMVHAFLVIGAKFPGGFT